MVARSVRDAEVPGSSPGTPTVRRPTDPPSRDPRDAPDWSFDVPIAPEAALQRVARSINLPKKRVFGLLKTTNEYIGVVDGPDFEIWERQGRAIHAVGRVRGVRGGSRIETAFVVTPRTRLLLIVFFVLYTLGAFGVAARGDQGLSVTSLAIAIAGSLVLTATFALGARRQREQLRAFVADLFRDVAS